MSRNLPFANLPEAARSDLEKLSRTLVTPKGRYFTTERYDRKLVASTAALGLITLVGVFAGSTAGWTPREASIAAAVVSLGAAVLVWNATRLWSCLRGRVQPGVAVNSALIVRVGTEAEDVRILRRAEVREIESVGKSRGRTLVTLRMNAEGVAKGRRGLLETFVVAWPNQAASLLQFLRRPAGESGAEDDFLAGVGQDGTRASVLVPWKRGLAILALAAGLSGGVWHYNRVAYESRLWSVATAAKTPQSYLTYLRSTKLNWHKKEAEEKYDDTSYVKAELARTAKALRVYLKAFPAGRNRVKGLASMRLLYESAEKAYFAKASKADPEAAAGIKALLAHLRESQAPTVYIKFVPGDPFDGNAFTGRVKRETGSTRVWNPGASFTAQQNTAREKRIVAVMQASFRTVLSADLFDLAAADPGGQDARFLVRYSVAGTDALYTWERENDLPISNREIFPGIQFGFIFSLQVPGSEHPPAVDPTEGYVFDLDVTPAPNFSVSGDGPQAVYSRMADTAFEKFEVDLAQAYGLERVMPSDWGKLPGDSAPAPRRSSFFDPPPLIPRTYAPPKFNFDDVDPLASLRKKRDVDSLIQESFGAGLEDPTEASIEASVRRKALLWKVALPDDRTLRSKIRTQILLRAAMRDPEVYKKLTEPPDEPPAAELFSAMLTSISDEQREAAAALISRFKGISLAQARDLALLTSVFLAVDVSRKRADQISAACAKEGLRCVVFPAASSTDK